MSLFTTSLKRVSRENDSLIAQAAKAVENKDSTDPVEINENSQFEAEIARLKAKTTSEDDPQSQTPEDPSNPPAQNEDEAGSEDDETKEDKKVPEVDEESVDKAAKEVSEEKPEEENKDADLQEAADTSSVSPEKVAAVEAFHAVLDHYSYLVNAHETGRIGKVHIGLCSATLNHVSRTQGIKLKSLSLESGDGVLERVMEFIKSLIAKVKAAFVSMYEWIKSFFQGYKAATGKHDQTVQGITDRVKYLKDSGVKVNEQMLAGKKVVVPGLFNVNGNQSSDVLAAVTDLIGFTKSVSVSLTSDQMKNITDNNLVLLSKMALVSGQSRHNGVSTLPISAQTIFGKVGNLSTLGNSSFIKNNAEMFSDGHASGVRINNLIGGYQYTWNLEANDNFLDILLRAERLRAIDFKQVKTASDKFEVEVLTLEQIEIVLHASNTLMLTSEILVDSLGSATKFAESLKNHSASVMAIITESIKKGVLGKQEGFIMSSIAAMTPDIFSRVVVNSLAKLIAHITATADSLSNWCVLSSKTIEEVIKKQ